MSYTISAEVRGTHNIVKLLTLDPKYKFDALFGISETFKFDIPAITDAQSMVSHLKQEENEVTEKFNPFKFKHMDYEYHFGTIDDFDEDKTEADFIRDQAVVFEANVTEDEELTCQILVIQKLTNPDEDGISQQHKEAISSSYLLN